MKIFAIGDLHLSFDENVNKSMEIFGEGWENYETRLKEAWCDAVSEEDVVIVPGDLSWGLKLSEAMADLNWIHELPGQKVLLKGNHDLWWSRISYIKTLFDDMFFIQNDCYYAEEADTAICGTRGWILPGSEEFTEHDSRIYRREVMRLGFSLDAAKKTGAGRIIAAMHYPPADALSKQSEFTDLLEENGVSHCVYGHLHGQIAFGKGIKGEHGGTEYRLVSLDYLGARPKLILDTDAEGE
jgi:predicted phosphohydrolase